MAAVNLVNVTSINGFNICGAVTTSAQDIIDVPADKIYKGLINASNFEIDFPKELTLILKFLKLLPDKLYFKIIRKLTKYQLYFS